MRDEKVVYHHTHIITVFERLRDLLVLILIPFVRGIYHAVLTQNYNEWLRGAKYDVGILLLMCGLAVLSWRMERYGFNEDGIIFIRGILRREKVFIKAEKITTFTCIKPFLFRPFGCTQIFCDTLAGLPFSYDKSFYISTQIADENMRLFEVKSTQKSELIYRPSKKSVFLFALFQTDSLTKIAVMIGFFSKIRDILNEELAQSILQQFPAVEALVDKVLNSAILGVMVVVLLFLVYGIVQRLLVYLSFELRVTNDQIQIESGVFTKRVHHINRESLCYIETRQSLTMRFFQITAAYVGSVGYGKGDKQIEVLIPSLKEKDMERLLGALLPEFRTTERVLKPKEGSTYLSYTWNFIVLSLLVLGLAILFFLFLPQWLFSVVGLLLLVPTFILWWMFAIKIIDVRTAGIGFSKEAYHFCYTTLLQFHRMIVPKNQLAGIKLTSSMYGNVMEKVTLRVYPVSEQGFCFSLQAMDRKLVKYFLLGERSLSIAERQKILEMEQVVGKDMQTYLTEHASSEIFFYCDISKREKKSLKSAD